MEINMDVMVLIYIEKVKNHFNVNQEAYEYFIGDSSPDKFFEQLAIISEKNLKESGNPELTIVQFELLKRTLKAITIAESQTYYDEKKQFLFFKDFPAISMN